MDSYNHKIKRLNPATGRVETLVGTGNLGRADGMFGRGALFQTKAISYWDGKLCIADTNNRAIRVATLARETLDSSRLRA